MQDKGLDEQFLDHAWSEMQELLDQEMPVEEKKKRRFLWLWFVMPLLVLGGLGVYWTIGNDKPSSLPKEQKREEHVQPIANQIIEEAGVHSEKNVDAVLPIADQKEVKKVLESTRRSFTNSKSITEKTPSSFAEQIDSRMTENENSLLPSMAKSDEKVRVFQEDQDSQKESFESLVPFEMATLDVLPISEIALLQRKRRTNDWSWKEVESDKKTIRPILQFKDWGLEVGVKTGNQQTFAGIAAGMTADFAMRDSKLGLSTGLLVDYVKTAVEPALESADVVAFDESDVSGAIDSLDTELSNGGFSGANSDPNANSYTIDRQRTITDVLQLKVPLRITYTVSPKWELSSGAYASYILSAYGEDDYEIRKFESNSGTPTNAFSYDREASVEEPILQRWNFGFELGLAYKPIPNLSIRLDASGAVRRWINLDASNNFNNVLQLGIRYHL